MTTYFWTGFSTFKIEDTEGSFYAELGNGKAVWDKSLEVVKAVLAAHEKLSRA